MRKDLKKGIGCKNTIESESIYLVLLVGTLFFYGLL